MANDQNTTPANLSKSLFTGKPGAGAPAGAPPSTPSAPASATPPVATSSPSPGILPGTQSNSAQPQVPTTSGGAVPTPAPAPTVTSTAKPVSGPGFKQAFVPAVGIPELQQGPIGAPTSPTFNQGSVEAVGDGPITANVAENDQAKAVLPKAGIMQGVLPQVAGAEASPEKSQDAPKLFFGLNLKQLTAKQKVYIGLGLVFVVVLGALLFSWLSTPEPEPELIAQTPVPQQKILLEYWGLWEPDDVMREVFREYEAKNNVTINYQKKNITSYRQELQDVIKQGNGPDLFRYHLTWGPMLKSELAAADPAGSSPYARTEFTSTFYPIASEHLNGESGITGVPLMYDGLVLLYNEDIFTQEGIAAPRDWGNFKSTARRLTQRDEAGKITQSGAAIGLLSNVDHGSDVLGLIATQYGVDLEFPDPTDVTNNTQMQRALQDFTSYYNDGETDVMNRVWDETMGDSLEEFAAGRVAMIMVPTFRILDLKAMNANLKIGVSTMPTLESSTDPAWASFWVEGVNAKSSANKQTEAWKLLTYLSSAEVLQKLHDNQLTLGRAIGEIYPRVGMANLLASEPYVQPLLAGANKAKTFYMCDNTWDEGINDNLIKYYEDAVTGMTVGLKNQSTKMGVAEAVALVQSGTVEIMTQYGIR